MVSPPARGDGRERPTSAVAGDADLERVELQLLRVVGHPLRHHPRVLDRRRPPMLGREPITDGDDDAGRALGERPHGAVMTFEVTDDPAAAVEVDERRTRLVRFDRPVDPHRHAVCVAVLDRMHLVHGPELLLADADVVGAGLLEWHGVDGRHGGVVREHFLDLRIEWWNGHGVILCGYFD
jgi:hypothetical protein